MPLNNQRSRFHINTPVKFNIGSTSGTHQEKEKSVRMKSSRRINFNDTDDEDEDETELQSGKQDKSVNTGHGPYCYRIQGMNYHRMGALLPDKGKPPMFSQLYIYDTKNEIKIRIKFISNGEGASSGKKKIDHQLITEIRDLLDTNNPLRDGRNYDLLTASEVATLIVGDFDSMEHKRDIILEEQGGDLKRISELHPSYLASQYPLLFPYAEDDIPKVYSMILNSIRLFQQFLLDGYTMIESERMSYIRREQKDLRSETYSKLAKVTADPDSRITIIDLFITFTCNPNGPEIARIVAEKGLKSDDHPDIGSIKYLFKYINKGPDKVTITAENEEVDEINDYYDCSSRSYSMKVKVLTTHLIRHRLMKQSFKLDGTKLDTFAQTLLYVEFPKYYVWKHDEKVWLSRQKGESIGHIHHVPPSWGEMFYLRVFLNKVRGAMDWEDLKKFDDVVYHTFKDACYARDILEDDKEYIDGLMSRPEFVYAKTWHVMATDVENIERVKKNAPCKTYLYKTMSAACRSQVGIILNVASSGIAALLLEGGRIAHSRFAIPINVVEDSMCNIFADSELVELLRMTKLIIWDEAPMVNRRCYEAFDMTMRDICRTDPSTPSEQLTVNKRLGSGSNSSERKEIQDFADWILNIGNGQIGGKTMERQMWNFLMIC
ncbi:ATP-dependent DNA helicase PIF1-like protein [Tanacetum coccineum]